MIKSAKKPVTYTYDSEPERGFYAFCDRLGATSRELATAKTKMTEAALWLREHLRRTAQ